MELDVLPSPQFQIIESIILGLLIVNKIFLSQEINAPSIEDCENTKYIESKVNTKVLINFIFKCKKINTPLR